MDRLKEALREYTSMSPESFEGQLILKDKFVTQLVPDIKRKLEKLANGPESTLENILKLATLFFYNRDQEETEEKKAKWREKAAALVAALQDTKIGVPVDVGLSRLLAVTVGLS